MATRKVITIKDIINNLFISFASLTKNYIFYHVTTTL